MILEQRLLIGILLCMSTMTIAQSKSDSSLKLEDIKLNNAPAFNLLDVSPSSIETMPSTRAIGLSIANAINMGNGIPQNYALEVTPFWLLKHKNMTCYKYLGMDSAGRNTPFSGVRFVSLSFAIVNKDSTTNIGTLTNHNFSIGARTTLIKVYRNVDTAKIRKYSRDIYTAQRKQFSKVITDPNKIKEATDAYQTATSEILDSLRYYLQQKPRFSLDLAMATNLSFDDNTVKGSRVSRTGIWANANFSFDLTDGKLQKSYCNLYGLGRYINTSDSVNTEGKFVSYNLFDFGGKLEFEFGKLAIGYEYIRRIVDDVAKKDTYKSVGVLQYKIKDGLFITGAFGKNFGDVNNIITTFGINWGFSSGVVSLK